MLLLLPVSGIEAQEKVALAVGGIEGQMGYSETQIEIVMEDILNEKFKSFGFQINLTMFPSKEKLDEAYENNQIHAIFSDPFVTLKHYDTYDKRAFLNLHYGGTPSKNELLVLVSKKSGIKSLKQLKNKRVTFYADNRLEQAYLETLLLRKKMGTIQHFFSQILKVKNGQKALLDVFFGKTDVTVVPKNVFETAGELNPQLLKNLVVLAKSKPMITRAVMIRKMSDYDRIIKEFMSQKSFQSGGNSTNMHLMQYDPTSFDELDSVMALWHEHQQLTKQ